MSNKDKDELAFGKENYRMFAIAAAIVLVGYLLMVGGGSDDPAHFNYDGLFSPIRITVAPILILIGFGLAFYAIVKRPKDD
ncbi:MAG: DUF3098 domain-containing protein [Bacteroidetes bacterium]|nr:MAG: DUF3098 domain-containing protein [Bacteroidota bacterium]MBL1143397.1 DUF3098 domain-containing protein [Bacteroidota bacterium]MCB0801480.1 DUF3098 domain-containing protein [Flavobacteriales bacterium]NOG56201.1 DUF3098 domain-containing protein [Bacteroidota bacterium]